MTYAHKLKFEKFNSQQHVKCIGWYYNFKAGKEDCKNKDVCKKYIDINTVKNWADLDKTRFAYISDFRTCKLYVENK